MASSPDGGTPQVGWGVVVLTQLIHPPAMLCGRPGQRFQSAQYANL